MSVRLSVVVPVYNVQDYLDECLQSLAQQDADNFEAICVNDGSTDASRDILAAWEACVSWMRVVDKPNGGLSSARNAGMRVAQGDYVCFLDSDDRLLPQACRRIVELFDQSDSQVLVYGGYALPREAATPWLEDVLSPQTISFGGPCEELLFGANARPFAWRTALSRDFMQDQQVYFDERVGYGEDQVFQFAAYGRSHRTTLVEDRLYEYRVTRAGSLMSGVRADERAMLLEHVRILRYVWEDYQALGLLDQLARPMLQWALAFVANDALLMDGAACSQVLGALGTAVGEHWTATQVEEMGLEPCELRVLQAALAGGKLGRLARRSLFAALHRHLYGRLSTARSLLGMNHGLQ